MPLIERHTFWVGATFQDVCPGLGNISQGNSQKRKEGILKTGFLVNMMREDSSGQHRRQNK